MTDQKQGTKILMEMLSCGLIEIRSLCRDGRTKQAEALADAMHNIPAFAIDPKSWNSKQLAAEFKEYKSKYSTSQRARCSYDYVAYLDRLKNVRTHQPAEGKS